MGTISQCDEIALLPYVKQGKKRRKLWAVKPTGHYQFDYETGQRLARYHIQALRDQIVSPSFTADVVKAMPDDKGGVEIAFLNELGVVAAA